MSVYEFAFAPGIAIMLVLKKVSASGLMDRPFW